MMKSKPLSLWYEVGILSVCIVNAQNHNPVYTQAILNKLALLSRQVQSGKKLYS